LNGNKRQLDGPNVKTDAGEKQNHKKRSDLDENSKFTTPGLF
jgi:hypothetical protein